MKISFILLAISILPFISKGQSSYGEFLQEKDIHRKAIIGLELWNVYLRSDLDSLKIAGVELLMTATDRQNEFARAVGMRMLGSYLYRSGKIDEGLEYLLTARDYFEEKKDYVITSEIFNEIGHALMLKGEFDEAIESYRNSIKLGKKSIDPTAVYNGKIGLGKAYVAKGDTSIGLKLVNQYKHLALEDGKYESVADALAYLGMIEWERGNRELCQEYYYRSQHYSRGSGSLIHLSHGFANFAIFKFEIGEMDSSLIYFERSLALREELHNTKGIVEGYFNLGDFYAYSGDADMSLSYFWKSKELAKETGLVIDELDALTRIIEVHSGYPDTSSLYDLRKELEDLSLVIEQKKGVDDEIINSLELDFAKKSKKEKKSPEFILNWKELTVIVLVIGLLIFFYAEKKRLS